MTRKEKQIIFSTIQKLLSTYSTIFTIDNLFMKLRYSNKMLKLGRQSYIAKTFLFSWSQIAKKEQSQEVP